MMQHNADGAYGTLMEALAFAVVLQAAHSSTLNKTFKQ